MADGTHAANGVTALAQFDADHDSTVDKQNAVFKELLVWRDADVTADLRIEYFNQSASTGYAVEHGNLHGLISSYTTADGVVHELADVWLAQAALASQHAIAHSPVL